MRTCDQEKNMKDCNCTYDPCKRKGICCECLTYHRGSGQLPACLFPDDVESTYDRSFSKFAQLVQSGRRWW